MNVRPSTACRCAQTLAAQQDLNLTMAPSANSVTGGSASHQSSVVEPTFIDPLTFTVTVAGVAFQAGISAGIGTNTAVQFSNEVRTPLLAP